MDKYIFDERPLQYGNIYKVKEIQSNGLVITNTGKILFKGQYHISTVIEYKTRSN